MFVFNDKYLKPVMKSLKINRLRRLIGEIGFDG